MVIIALTFSGCGPTARPMLLLVEKFASFTLPIYKKGRTAANFALSGGKFVLKLEQEVTKSGIKVGATVPLFTFQDIAAVAYKLTHNGDAPEGTFDEKNGIFIIVVHNGERTIFVSEQNKICVANVIESKLIRIDMNARAVFIPVSKENTEVMFGASDEECDGIDAEIKNRKIATKKALIPLSDANAKSTAGISKIPPQINYQECKKPEYPEKALEKEKDGVVILSLLVDTNGRVIASEIEKSSDSRILDETTIAAISLCTFKPGLNDGRPEKAWVRLKYTWVIEKQWGAS
jgi:TonB family protein